MSDALLEQLRARVGFINAQLGTGIQVVENRDTARCRYYGCYQLRDGEGRPLHPTWRNYATMTYHLGTVEAVLGQARREGP